MRFLLTILTIVNFIVFWTVLLGFGASPISGASRLWIATVVAAAGIAFFRGRGSDERSATVRLHLVAAFAAPLAVLLLWHRIVSVFMVFSPVFGRSADWLLIWIGAPSIMAYYALPTVFGVTYVLTTAGFLAFAIWKPTFRSFRWKMSFLSVVVFCYVAYLLHWYLTGQKWVWL